MNFLLEHLKTCFTFLQFEMHKNISSIFTHVDCQESTLNIYTTSYLLHIYIPYIQSSSYVGPYFREIFATTAVRYSEWPLGHLPATPRQFLCTLWIRNHTFYSTFASVTRPIVKEHRSTRPTQRSHHVGFGSWRRKNWCFFRTKKNSRIGNLMDIETHKLQSFSCLPVIHLKAFASTTS